MAGFAATRCLNHSRREAVCRCASCRNFFCRECAVSYESRLLCAECLAQQSSQTAEQRRRFGVGGILLAIAGFIAAWLLFYLAGWGILQLREHEPLAKGDRSAMRLLV